jgi:hypothetical protein
LIHHLLAAYSLGASKEKLQEIYDDHAKDQRPIPASIGTITRENFKSYLGKAEAYTSFLALFQSEIDKHGAVDTVRRWIWSGDFLARTVGGAYHPVIHIGYGLEFGIPGIVAEGLAMSACTESFYSKIVPDQPDLSSSALVPAQAQVYAENASSTVQSYVTQFVDQLSNQISSRLGISDKTTSSTPADRSAADDTTKNLPDYLKENSLFTIFSHIRNDPVFDNLFAVDDNMKFKTLLANVAAVERIKHYANQWVLEENTKSVQNKLQELWSWIAVALGSTGMRKDHPGVLKLDFFVMHALTSTEFLHQYVSRVTPSESVSLLHAHLSATMLHYITAGRPDLYVDGFLAYKSPTRDEKSNNNWLNVFDKALSCKEPHVIKTVRSCAVAQVVYGRHQDAKSNAAWLQVAEMAVDKDGHWDFSGVGFDYTWEKDDTSNAENQSM